MLKIKTLLTLLFFTIFESSFAFCYFQDRLASNSLRTIQGNASAYPIPQQMPNDPQGPYLGYAFVSVTGWTPGSCVVDTGSTAEVLCSSRKLRATYRWAVSACVTPDLSFGYIEYQEIRNHTIPDECCIYYF